MSHIPLNEKADGYRGIWYFNQPTGDQFVYKYSGGLATFPSNHHPFAHYAPQAHKTFFVYGGAAANDNHLLIMASFYDHATHTLPRPTIVCDKQTDDAHDNPVLCLDGDGFLWVFAAAHGRARPAFIFRGRQPYSADAFDLIRVTNFSYPQPHYLPHEGFFFFHTLYNGGRQLYFSTSRDGRLWSDPERLASIAQGHYQVSSAHGDVLATAFNYHPGKGGLNFRTNLYYLQTTDFGRTWKTASAEPIGFPLREVANDALVHDYEREGLKVYLHDVNFDAQGRPVILFLTARGWQPGPENGPRVWSTAHWTGREWRILPITTSDNNYDTGCLHIEGNGLWRVIGPTHPGPQPYSPGGEIAIWLSDDQGATWRLARQVTHDSPYNHTYVRRPLNAHPDFYAFWADGHARQPSESRLYFCNQSGDRVYRLPLHLNTDRVAPEPVE